MIVVDTSALLAALDRSEPEHEAVRRCLEGEPAPYLLSPFVLAEADHLLATRRGVAPELVLLGDVARGAYKLEPFDPADVKSAATLVERYRDLDIGLADASVVVLAARWSTDRILTLDERHFRAMRPLRGRAFKLLPSDA